MQRCLRPRASRLPPRLHTAPRPTAFGGRAVTRRLRHSCVKVCAATTLYEVLGVQQTATSREIKAAYRKLALKLHPDVNKAPDAKDRFIEAKRAFETLADDKARADYDRQLRVGSMGGWGSSGFGGSYSGTSGGSYRRPNTPAEDNYTLDDLLRDLEKEFSSWSQSRASGKPTSIWDDIESLGGELLDFVEDSLGIKEEEAAKGKGGAGSSSAGGSSTGSSGTGSTSSTSSSSGAGSNRSTGASSEQDGSKSAAERFDDFVRTYDTPSGTGSGASSSSSRTGAGASTGGASGDKKQGSSADDIDDMLLALKKKLNKL